MRLLLPEEFSRRIAPSKGTEHFQVYLFVSFLPFVHLKLHYSKSCFFNNLHFCMAFTTMLTYFRYVKTQSWRPLSTDQIHKLTNFKHMLTEDSAL